MKQPFTPHLRAMQLIGFAPFSIHNNTVYTSKYLTSYALIFVIISISITARLVWELYIIQHHDVEESSKLEIVVSSILLALGIIAYLTTTFEAILKRSHLMRAFELTISANQLMRKGLNYHVSYNVYRSHQIVYLLVLIGIYVIPQLFICAWYQISWKTIYRLAIPQFFVTIRVAQGVSCMLAVGARCKFYNRAFRKEFHSGMVSQDNFRLFHEIYGNFCEICFCINEHFGWSLLTAICYDFVCISSTLFVLLFKGHIGLDFNTRPLIVPICNIILLVLACEFTVMQVSSI